MLNRLLVAAVIAPIGLVIAGTIIVNAAYPGVGMAAVPFLLTAYVFGALLSALLATALPQSMLFRTALLALAICGLCAITRTNTQIVLWTVGAPAVGGLAVTAPLPRAHDPA